ncbi:MAG TPA: hypothetical protein VH482_37985 [Thermomicrobiales bacterium]|jgi:hypothetical protein
MSGVAWKDLERRICRALGVERRPSIGPGGYARGSDDDGRCRFAVEVKRTTRYQLRQSWVAQARRNGKADRRPWLLVIAEHGDRVAFDGGKHPVAVLDFMAFVELLERAGMRGPAE